MKRLLSLLLVIAMLFGVCTVFTACDSTSVSDEDDDDDKKKDDSLKCNGNSIARLHLAINIATYRLLEKWKTRARIIFGKVETYTITLRPSWKLVLQNCHAYVLR